MTKYSLQQKTAYIVIQWLGNIGVQAISRWDTDNILKTRGLFQYKDAVLPRKPVQEILRIHIINIWQS